VTNDRGQTNRQTDRQRCREMCRNMQSRDCAARSDVPKRLTAAALRMADCTPVRSIDLIMTYIMT